MKIEIKIYKLKGMGFCLIKDDLFGGTLICTPFVQAKVTIN